MEGSDKKSAVKKEPRSEDNGDACIGRISGKLKSTNHRETNEIYPKQP